MNKKNIIIFTGILVVVALLSPFVAMRLGKVAAVDLTDPDENIVPSVETENKSSKAIEVMQTAKVELDDLWEKTLFNPERVEKQENSSGESVAEQQMNAEFELAGIAVLGVPGKAEPVAIIRARAKENTRARRSTSSRNGSRGGSNAGNRRKTNTSDNETPKGSENVKTVFRTGEVVGNTGYVLAAIHPDEKMVELSRGREVIRLFIEYKNEQSAERRQAAVQREEQLKKVRSERDEQMAQARRDSEAARNSRAVRPDNGGGTSEAEEEPRPISDPPAGSAPVSTTESSVQNANDADGERPEDAPPPPPRNPSRSARNQK